MNWTEQFATRTARIKPSTIREILKLTQRSEVISFAGGLPAPGLFPVEKLSEAASKVLQGKRSRSASVQHHRRVFTLARMGRGNVSKCNCKQRTNRFGITASA